MTLTLNHTTFHWGTQTYLMGIVNVTPDSFSGDGLARGDEWGVGGGGGWWGWD